jgi:hypothetical protein
MSPSPTAEQFLLQKCVHRFSISGERNGGHFPARLTDIETAYPVQQL